MITTISDKILNFVKLDEIRIQKLLHMSQITFFGLFISLLIAPYFNKYSFNLNKNDGILIIFLKTSLELIMLVILLYYIRKLTKIPPLIFKFSKKYNEFHKSSDGENLVGNTIAMAIVFMNFVGKMKEKIIYLGKCVNNN